ncbi:MAG: beta-galactosidase [Candidatus Portnoybacteria bacterium]|nr:beta-galactosidase [Candidatus Portnoybacteria bacterium]
MKKFFTLLIILGIIVGALFYLSRETADPNREIKWGVTFSKPFAQKLNLDWKKAYPEILDDLKIKQIRLVAYWPEVEPQKDTFDFNDLDWQINEAAKRNVKIILAVGLRLPRWPECHVPEWSKNQETEAANSERLAYIEAVINRYKNNSAIFAWQVENEPFLKFGDCPAYDSSFLDKEIEKVRVLDKRPIIITDSGELSIWIKAAKRADIFGTTMYRWVWHDWVGSYKYPIPAGFFRAKERIARFFVGQEKPFIVIELQGEPWGKKQIYEMTPDEQIELFSLNEFQKTIDYAKKTGFSEYYLWGVEWWNYLKQNGHEEYWEYVKALQNTD